MKSRSNSRASPVSSETIDEIVTLEIERCKLLYESGVLDDDEINTRSDQLRREIDHLRLTRCSSLNSTSTANNTSGDSIEGNATYPSSSSRNSTAYPSRQSQRSMGDSSKNENENEDDSANYNLDSNIFDKMDRNYNEEVKENEEDDPYSMLTRTQSLIQSRTGGGYYSRNASANNSTSNTPTRGSISRRQSYRTIRTNKNSDSHPSNSISNPIGSNKFGKDEHFMDEIDHMRALKSRDLLQKKEKHSSMSIQKSGHNSVNSYRPVSMSLSRRRSVTSASLDVGTLALLESLNLLSTNNAGSNIDSTNSYDHSATHTPPYSIPDKNNGTNGGTYFDDNVIDNQKYKDDNDNDNEEDNDILDELRDSYDENDIGYPNGKLNDLIPIDSVYRDIPQPLEVIHEDSPYYFSTNNSPEKIRVKLDELKERRTRRSVLPSQVSSQVSEQVLNNNNNLDLSVGKNIVTVPGLMAGGVLEFCTVDADILSLMLDEVTYANINNKNCSGSGGGSGNNDSGRDQDDDDVKVVEVRKKSIYDIIDDDSFSPLSPPVTLPSSYIPPNKSYCMPSDNFTIEHIHDFCFPSGVSVDFVSEQKATILTESSGKITTQISKFLQSFFEFFMYYI